MNDSISTIVEAQVDYDRKLQDCSTKFSEHLQFDRSSTVSIKYKLISTNQQPDCHNVTAIKNMSVLGIAWKFTWPSYSNFS